MLTPFLYYGFFVLFFALRAGETTSETAQAPVVTAEKEAEWMHYCITLRRASLQPRAFTKPEIELLKTIIPLITYWQTHQIAGNNLRRALIQASWQRQQLQLEHAPFNDWPKTTPITPPDSHKNLKRSLDDSSFLLYSMGTRLEVTEDLAQQLMPRAITLRHQMSAQIKQFKDYHPTAQYNSPEYRAAITNVRLAIRYGAIIDWHFSLWRRLFPQIMHRYLFTPSSESLAAHCALNRGYVLLTEDDSEDTSGE